MVSVSLLLFCVLCLVVLVLCLLLVVCCLLSIVCCRCCLVSWVLCLLLAGWLFCCRWCVGLYVCCFVVLPGLFLRSGFVFLVFVLVWLGGLGCFGWWYAVLFKGRCFSGILAAYMPQTLYSSIIE